MPNAGAGRQNRRTRIADIIEGKEDDDSDSGLEGVTAPISLSRRDWVRNGLGSRCNGERVRPNSNFGALSVG